MPKSNHKQQLLRWLYSCNWELLHCFLGKKHYQTSNQIYNCFIWKFAFVNQSFKQARMATVMNHLPMILMHCGKISSADIILSYFKSVSPYIFLYSNNDSILKKKKKMLSVQFLSVCFIKLDPCKLGLANKLTFWAA